MCWLHIHVIERRPTCPCWCPWVSVWWPPHPVCSLLALANTVTWGPACPSPLVQRSWESRDGAVYLELWPPALSLLVDKNSANNYQFSRSLHDKKELSSMSIQLPWLLVVWSEISHDPHVRLLHVWQIGPNLSSGIRWCLALASVKPQWCLLWRFLCVCMCVCPCEWWYGPCMCDGSLLNSCYLFRLWYIKPKDLSTVTHQRCLQYLPQLCAVAWSESHFGDVSF